jgi:hypothetical protein
VPRRTKDFRKDVVERVLLWCGRHCCVCGRQCGVGIEIAHIDANGGNDIDNAIPLCFDCHSEIGHYNKQHPRGRSFSPNELRNRRDQVYEQHTSQLLPRLRYRLTRSGKTFPDVGFTIEHLSGPFPVQVRVKLVFRKGNKTLGVLKANPHYNGTRLWNLNPSFGVNGHFEVPRAWVEPESDDLRVEICVTVVDIYGREHSLLPIAYVHRLEPDIEWYLEPSPAAF